MPVIAKMSEVQNGDSLSLASVKDPLEPLIQSLLSTRFEPIEEYKTVIHCGEVF